MIDSTLPKVGRRNAAKKGKKKKSVRFQDLDSSTEKGILTSNQPKTVRFHGQQ
jgi:hypothetical protein